MTNIFAETAGFFWDEGYSAIPLKEKSKAPTIGQFPKYKDEMPSLKEQENWKHNWPDGNIGLVMGQSVVITNEAGGSKEYASAMMDTDGADCYVRFAEAVIGPGFCARSSARGGGHFILVPKDIKTLQLKNCEDKHIYDLLTNGSQVVVPPSIHPSGVLYKWLGEPLYKRKRESLPILGHEKITFMKAVISMEAHLDLINDGPTHVAVRDIAWHTAHLVDEDTFYNAIESLLSPGYDGNIKGEIRTLYRTARKKKLDPGIETFGAVKKESPVDTLLNMVGESKEIELFHSEFRVACISFREEGKGQIVYPLSSTAAEMKLKMLYYKRKNKPISKDAFAQVRDTLCARALYDSPQKKVLTRVGRDNNSVIINLADEAGRVVVIDSEAVNVTEESPLMRTKPDGLEEMPEPEFPPGDPFKQLQEVLGIDSANLYRLIAFCIGCWKPEGPYFLLILEGEQGSGKSFLCSLIKSLLDPSQAPKLSLPDSVRNLMIMAKHIPLLVFDNVSHIDNEMSDALCSLATGGGFAVRKHYKDEELQFFNESRPMIMNGICGVGKRPDIMNRAIYIELPVMPQEKRKTEQEIKTEFEKLRPRLMAKLCEAISCALKNFDHVKTPKSMRMADATKWIVAAEPAMGLPAGTLLQALEESQVDVLADRMADNPIANALYDLVQPGPYFGRMGELYNTLKSSDHLRYDHSFPRTSMHFSSELDRMRPALEKTGIIVEFGKKGRDGRHLTVYLPEHGPERVEAARKTYEMMRERSRRVREKIS